MLGIYISTPELRQQFASAYAIGNHHTEIDRLLSEFQARVVQF